MAGRTQGQKWWIRRGVWIGLGAGAYAVHLWLGRDSGLAEKFYSRGLYAGIRQIWDNTLGFSPIPLLTIVLSAAILFYILRLCPIFLSIKLRAIVRNPSYWI